MPQNDLNHNRVALITGAAKRIGAAIANRLHREGFRVIIHYQHSEKEAALFVGTLNEIRANSAFAIQADLNDPKQYSLLIQKAVKIWDRLDVLVNNASIFPTNKIGSTSLEEWNHIWNVNTAAPFFLTQEALPFLKQQENACIVNITDTHADARPTKNYSVYSMSKAALLMQTQALARELSPHIRINAVAPGLILWEEDTPTEIQKDIMSRTPLKRAGFADEVAKAVVYLVTEASFTTGTTLYVDGGRCVYN